MSTLIFLLQSGKLFLDHFEIFSGRLLIYHNVSSQAFIKLQKQKQNRTKHSETKTKTNEQRNKNTPMSTSSYACPVVAETCDIP